MSIEASENPSLEAVYAEAVYAETDGNAEVAFAEVVESDRGIPVHITAARDALDALARELDATYETKSIDVSKRIHTNDVYTEDLKNIKCYYMIGARKDLQRMYESGGVMSFYIGNGMFRLKTPETGKIIEVPLEFLQHVVATAIHGCYENPTYSLCDLCAHHKKKREAQKSDASKTM